MVFLGALFCRDRPLQYSVARRVGVVSRQAQLVGGAIQACSPKSHAHMVIEMLCLSRLISAVVFLLVAGAPSKAGGQQQTEDGSLGVVVWVLGTCGQLY